MRMLMKDMVSVYRCVPGGLVVWIRRSHRRGGGSIPRLGTSVEVGWVVVHPGMSGVCHVRSFAWKVGGLSHPNLKRGDRSSLSPRLRRLCYAVTN